MASIVRVGQSKFVAVPIDEDSQERILNFIRTVAELQDSKPANEIFLTDTKAAYGKMVLAAEKKVQEKKMKDNKSTEVQVDDLISFRQFSKKPTGGDADEVSAFFLEANWRYLQTRVFFNWENSSRRIWCEPLGLPTSRTISSPSSARLSSLPVRVSRFLCLKSETCRSPSPFTGFSDPVYSEAIVTVHGFDINLGKQSSRASTRLALLS